MTAPRTEDECAQRPWDRPSCTLIGLGRMIVVDDLKTEVVCAEWTPATRMKDM